MAIIGVDTCRHNQVWSGMSKIKCTKCNKEWSGHARKPGTDYCIECEKDH